MAVRVDKTKLLTKHYTKGRGGEQIEYVVLHHNAGNLTVEGCWDVWQTREASAHYQVEYDGTRGRLVRDEDTAWHAANGPANRKSISIEHANSKGTTGPLTDATLKSGAELVAELCIEHGLGRPRWKKNVFPHSHFTSTACPGHIAGSQNPEYMKAAQAHYDKLTGKEVTMASSNLPPISWTHFDEGQTSGKANGNVKIIQGYLRRQGIKYMPKLPDGIHDDYSFAGVTTWQVAAGRKPTGKLSPEDFTTLVDWGKQFHPINLPVEPKRAAVSATSAKSTYVRPVRDHVVHPISAAWRKPGKWAAGHHTGVDIACPSGTPVYATIGGDVRTKARRGIWGAQGTSKSHAYGIYIVINDDKDGSDWAYCHLSKVLVKEGQKVKTGQLIGYSGNTGNSTGPHLHVERRPRYGRYGSDRNPNLWP